MKICELIEAKVDTTQSPEFKRWFGNSKIVDEQGRPLVVYHGSGSPGFSVFMRSAYGYIYTTVDKSYASSFGGSGAVYPVYVSIKNYLDLTKFGEKEISGEEFENYLKNKNIDTEGLKLDEKRFKLRPWAWIKNPNIKYRLEDAGYDGIKMIENVSDMENRPGGSLVYVVFEPYQIKSAVGNIGKYSTDDSDITKEELI